MAKAYDFKARASRLQDIKQDEAHKNLRKAAELFVSIGKADLAAECFIDLGDFKKAGRIYFLKGGTCDMKKAGECFRSARCYQLAAESYAEGNHIAECLAACLEGDLLDKGLQYILGWKGDTSVNSEYLNWNAELVKVAHNFLEKCAIEFHARKDMHAMMKFVRAFDSIVSTRKFLRSVDCLEELLKLEDESGNFLEAAEIADELGNTPLQADLLFKAGQFKESSILLLWHVFANSLWNPSSGGWPLKLFSHKDDLLLKSKLIAAKEDGIFSELVDTEVKLLSHKNNKISSLWQYFGDSAQHQSLRGQFISVRKILDVHFDSEASSYVWGDELPVDLEKESLQRILFDQKSPATLFHFWKHLSTLIVQCCKSIQDIDSKTFDDMGVVEFCLNFFGVRRQSTRYRLLIPDAQWVKNLNVPGSFSKCGKFNFVDKSGLVLAVRKYWEAELVSTSLKVLETLQILHDFSVNSSRSVFRQSMCLIYMYKVTGFLHECNYSYCKINEGEKLREYCQLSHRFIFNVFPRDWRHSMVRNMICLRQNQDAQDLLSGIISQTIRTRSPLTYRQIGKVLMIFLGSDREFSGRFLEDEAWKDVFEILRQTRKSDALCEYLQVNLTSGRGNNQDRISAIIKFLIALEDSYRHYGKVTNDHISLGCFIYVIDRLVILSSGFQELFFTMKSSFTEWILHEQPDTYECSFTLLTDSHFSVQHAYDYVIKIITWLLFSRRDVEEWIRICNFNPYSYPRLLCLRLVVLLVLICLNSGNYFHFLKQILDNNDIRHLLPRKFYDLCYAATCNGILDLSMVAKALETIGDPLVIVSFTESRPQITAPAAIFIGMAKNLKKDDILDLLFPRGTMDQSQGVSVLVPTAETAEILGEPSLVGESSSGNSITVKSSAIPHIGNKESSIDMDYNDTVFDWVCFKEIYDHLRSGRILNKEMFTRLDFEEKVEESINSVTAAVALSSANERLSDGDINLTDEMDKFLEDLHELSSAFGSRNEELEENGKHIEQLLGKLLSRRPLLESYFNELLAVDEPVDWEFETDEKSENQDEISRESDSKDDCNIPGHETESDDKKLATGKGDGEGMANTEAEKGSHDD
ncbi:hypothetical protein LIER_35613 [Lithospermum erythrorhizon]|uniref:Uncharacterized protein n=1 Tax=Lithospermum erythrorhizon TaxID=34254 RepID=A0AAV3NTJ2_LITER